MDLFWGVGLFGIIFGLFFFVVSVMFTVLFVYILVKNVSKHKKNDASPRMTVDATVVAKRTDVRGVDINITDYYVTFQVESGDRMELEIEGTQYGMLVEGDVGKLSFQGTRFLDFQR